MKPIIKLNSRSLFVSLMAGLLLVMGLAILPLVRAADVTAGSAAELATAIDTINAAGPGNHTITLTDDITLSALLPAFNNTEATRLTLDGAGHTLDAAGVGTALTVLANTTATVQNLTITGGSGSSGPDGLSGGGIFNRGELTVIDSTITGNSGATGAGIYTLPNQSATASLTLSGVTLSENEASYMGGGLAATGFGGKVDIEITDSVISDNSAISYGGGVAATGHSGSTVSLHITDTTLRENASRYGGAIFNNGNNGVTELTLERVTLSDNTATNSGGGIFNNGNLGTAEATLLNTTLSGNSAVWFGGGIANTSTGGSAEVTLSFVTLADNWATSGGGLYIISDSVEMVGTLVSAGTQGGACALIGSTAINSGGYNLDTDGTCNLDGTGDISEGEADLVALALNAPGTTATHALGVNSDALQQVPDGVGGCGTTVTTDQRGVMRPSPAPLCDIGAYESGEGGVDVTPTATVPSEVTPTATVPSGETPPAPTPTYTATGTPPPPDCTPPYAPATEQALDDAIYCVNEAGAGTHTITLAGDISLSRATRPLDNSDGQLVIDGNGHTIDGKYKGTVLTVSEGTTARVFNITLINGQASRGPDNKWGGAVYNQGDLTIENSTLSGNLSDRGGAIANHSSGAAARLTVSGSTLSGNAAALTGGGIFNMSNDGGSATVEALNVTISGNLANSGGGGLYNASLDGSATADLRYVTFAVNSSTNGGGAIHAAQTGGSSAVSLVATIVSHTLGMGANCSVAGGTLTSGGYNLSSDNTCQLTQASDLPSANARLLPLAVNPPGTTATFALGENSPAVNHIPAGQAGCGMTVAADQRGAPRPMPAGEGCDVGAYERQTTQPEPEPDDDLKLMLPIVIR